jgi:beta-glucosidase/6-phospho-beta-glucosidase/beta-galactosidase
MNMTGVEGSYPIVHYEGKQIRRDLLEESGGNFYINHRERLQRTIDAGIKTVRWGPSLHKTLLGPNIPQDVDNDFTDTVIAEMQELGNECILDLVHFGVPDWVDGCFQNKQLPEILSQYAGHLAQRYPHIRYYTPINEKFVTAKFSALDGLWNEGMRDEKAFVRASSILARSEVLMCQEIDKVRELLGLTPAIYIVNESFERAIAMPDSGREQEAEDFNTFKFVSMDLAFGHYNERAKRWLLTRGMDEKEYDWFMENGSKVRRVVGVDKYRWTEHELHAGGNNRDYGFNDPDHLDELVIEAYERWGMPIVHTETNAWPEHAAQECERTYKIMDTLQKVGYPIPGKLGWYGEESQTDWQHALMPKGEETPVGLWRNGQPQPALEVMQKIVSQAQERNHVYTTV